jgi:methylenetetrahydrofolate reductase (NADPH)
MSLSDAFDSGKFVVTAELGPPRGADPDAVRDKAALVRGWVDAVNITDNQGATVRMSSLAGSVLALQAGVEPVMQLTTRDRNRMALQSDLLAAGALGIPNVLLLTGDHPKFGDHSDGKPVFDLDSVQLMSVARMMRDHRRLMSGRSAEPPPRFLIGAVENPYAPPQEFRAARLGKKVEAGAEFVQTQYVFDVDGFAEWMAAVRDLGLDEKCRVLAGVGPIRSARALEHMRTNVPGIHIPQAVVDRLMSVPEEKFTEEGLRICAETIERLREIPAVSGVHVMAVGNERAIPEILQRAGLERVSDHAG